MQQLAFGDHVGAGAEPGERRDHRLVGVGLERIADERVDVGKGAGEHPVVPLQGRARIAVERGADRLGERHQIDGLGAEHAVAIGEVMHGACLEHQPEEWKLGVRRDRCPDRGLGLEASERPPPQRGIVDRYCSSGSRRNGFFWPGVAAGLPCGSKPVLAMVSCDVSGAADASAGAGATGPGGGALKAAGAG